MGILPREVDKDLGRERMLRCLDDHGRLTRLRRVLDVNFEKGPAGHRRRKGGAQQSARSQDRLLGGGRQLAVGARGLVDGFGARLWRFRRGAAWCGLLGGGGGGGIRVLVLGQRVLVLVLIVEVGCVAW